MGLIAFYGSPEVEKIVIAVTHANTWFWTQTCMAALKRHLTKEITDAFAVEIIVVDNSWDNSPSILGITKTRLGEGVKVVNNTRASLCHSAALDVAFEASWPMTYFVPVDSDVVILKPEWLREFLRVLKPTDYAVGDWHHEEWIYPSFALYRGEAVKGMADASQKNADDRMRWGENFEQSVPIPDGHDKLLRGPFSERRGWPRGTVLKQKPSGQLKGPAHYEPGQQFHHWALEAGYTYSVFPAITVRDYKRNIPLGTFYGIDPKNPETRFVGYNEARDACLAMHMWGGTRAWDYLNPRGGDLDDPCIVNNMHFWIEREVGWWLNQVPEDVRAETLKLIKEHGWTFRPRPDAPPDAMRQILGWCGDGGVTFS